MTTTHRAFSIEFLGIRDNGAYWVADFRAGTERFCLNRESLKSRIENLRKGGHSVGVEEAALADLQDKPADKLL